MVDGLGGGFFFVWAGFWYFGLNTNKGPFVLLANKAQGPYM
jgi:hypothetical protein